MGVIQEKTQVIVRGFRVYVESSDKELYDLFIPTNLDKLSKKNVQHLIPDKDTILVIKRDNQHYEMSIDDIEQFGTKIN